MGELLSDAIESVLIQTYKNYEIIIVDDGSTDNTRKIAEKYLAKGVRYHHQKNQGVAAARNAGIRLSKGEFVAFLDADDLWLPDKLELQMNAMHEFNVGIIACGYRLVDYVSGSCLSEIVRKNYRGREELYKTLCISQIIPACSSGMVIKIDYFRTAGYFNETLKIAEDWEIWLRLAEKYDIKFVERPLVQLRVNIEKPNYRVISNEELYVRQVIKERVPLKYRSKSYAALYARLGRSCLARWDRGRGMGYLLRSILWHPFRIYPRDSKNEYKYPQIWRYYLLIKSLAPGTLIKIIKSFYPLPQ
jgi:glycosyltransferase involved in cell wall biosynthesis